MNMIRILDTCKPNHIDYDIHHVNNISFVFKWMTELIQHLSYARGMCVACVKTKNI